MIRVYNEFNYQWACSRKLKTSKIKCHTNLQKEWYSGVRVWVALLVCNLNLSQSAFRNFHHLTGLLEVEAKVVLECSDE